MEATMIMITNTTTSTNTSMARVANTTMTTTMIGIIATIIAKATSTMENTATTKVSLACGAAYGRALRFIAFGKHYRGRWNFSIPLANDALFGLLGYF